MNNYTLTRKIWSKFVCKCNATRKKEKPKKSYNKYLPVSRNQGICLRNMKYVHFSTIKTLYIFLKFVGSRKFQNIYMRIYWCFKSCILLDDDRLHGQKHVTFINDIIKSILYFTVIDKPVLIICKMKVRFTL